MIYMHTEVWGHCSINYWSNEIRALTSLEYPPSKSHHSTGQNTQTQHWLYLTKTLYTLVFDFFPSKHQAKDLKEDFCKGDNILVGLSFIP